MMLKAGSYLKLIRMLCLLYQQLLRSYPDNSNFKYRIGQCYINIPGEKDKAISYLEDAVKNINPKYKEGKFNETGAPYDAFIISPMHTG